MRARRARECAPAARSDARPCSPRCTPSRSRGSSRAEPPAARAPPVSMPPRCVVWKRASRRPLKRAADRVRLLGDLLAHVVRVVALVERLVASRRSVERRLGRRAAVERRASRSRRRARQRSRRRRDARRCCVWRTSAAASEATNISRSPMPSTTGLPLRATTMESGRWASTPRGHTCRSRGAARARTESSSVSAGVARDQMREHLRVRLGAGSVTPLGLELRPELRRRSR